MEKLKTMKSRRLLGTEKTLVHHLRFGYSMLPILNTNLQLYLYNQLYLHTYTLDQRRFWETDRFSASQEIAHILRHPKVPFRVKCPPRAPILNQISSTNDPPIHFLQNRLNIILPPAPGLSKRSLSLRFSQHEPCMHLSSPPHMCYMPRPSHSSQVDIWSVHIKLLIM